MLLNNQWSIKKIKEEFKKISLDKWNWKYNCPKSIGCSKSSSNREVHRETGLPQETRKSQIYNLNVHLKKLGGKKEQAKPS